MSRLRTTAAFTVLLLATLTGTSRGATLEAVGVLPPGQSGYVSIPGAASGTGSPHLTDQISLFENFEYRDINFNQPGPSETPRAGVTIVRDNYGVPSITGTTENDAWFGVGYAIAQDRLFELELFRRATAGRLSEIVGPGFLDDDLIARRDYYTDDEVQEMFDGLSPDLKARTQSYADGINAWIDQVTGPQATLLPGEFAALGVVPIDDWTVLDSTRVGIQLARTVPSSDGAELRNALALDAAGPRAFKKLLPIRTKGALATVPRSEGIFPAQPGRSPRDLKRGFRKSKRYLARTDLSNVTDTADQIPRASTADANARSESPADEPGAGLRSIFTSPGGSYMWAISDPDRQRGYLYNGPQLGFAAPELFVEFEIHSPEFPNLHGVSAPGVPVMGIGHNGKVAWGFTSGLSDEDDLYVEKVTGTETYMYKGEERQMDCRDEEFTWRTPPTDLQGTLLDLISGGGSGNGAGPAGTTTERICRTIHGPVQQLGDGIALSRRYAIWNRELETIVGIDLLSRAKNIRDVDAAMDEVTWNENVIATDSRGNIGYWHPGLHQLKPKTWDERLPFPGTGQAEWRGLLPKDKRPQVINPPQGWLANWNNVPSAGWTNGDSEAGERATGPLHRVRLLRKLVAKVARNPSFDKSTDINLRSGTAAQQFPFRDRRKLRAARSRAGSDGRALLRELGRWDGNYDREAPDGTVDPGVAIWEEFKDQLERILLRRLGPGLEDLSGEPGRSHMFDASNGEVAALRMLRAQAYSRAADRSYQALATRFGTTAVATFREPRRLYEVAAQGAASVPDLEFFDRGTWNQSIAMGR